MLYLSCSLISKCQKGYITSTTKLRTGLQDCIYSILHDTGRLDRTASSAFRFNRVSQLVTYLPVITWDSVIVLCYVVRTLCSFELTIILIGKRELVALLSLPPWCLVIVVLLFLMVPWACLQFVIVVFSDHTYFLSLEAILHFCENLDQFFISEKTSSSQIRRIRNDSSHVET